MLNTENAMKIPIFFFNTDDNTGTRPIGRAADLATTLENLTAELRALLDELETGRDGDVFHLRLSRHDMTEEELEALPEE